MTPAARGQHRPGRLGACVNWHVGVWVVLPAWALSVLSNLLWDREAPDCGPWVLPVSSGEWSGWHSSLSSSGCSVVSYSSQIYTDREVCRILADRRALVLQLVLLLCRLSSGIP